MSINENTHLVPAEAPPISQLTPRPGAICIVCGGEVKTGGVMHQRCATGRALTLAIRVLEADLARDRQHEHMLRVYSLLRCNAEEIHDTDGKLQCRIIALNNDEWNEVARLLRPGNDRKESA